MTKKLNIDPRFNPKTTIVGVIMIFSSLFVIMGAYVIDFKQAINYWIVGSIGSLGIVLLLSPDKLIEIISLAFKSIINKFFGNGSN